MEPRGARLRLIVALLTAALLATACDTPTPAPVQDPTALDRADLDAILAADHDVDAALKKADDDEARDDDAAAAKVLRTEALPLAQQALATARTKTPRTAWGKKEHDALVSLLKDRKAAIPRYAAALEGTSLEDRLAAVQRQAELEKRAMTLSGEIHPR